MEFEKLLNKIKEELIKPLPGKQAQMKMSSLNKIANLFKEKSDDALKSSVLILIYPNLDDPCLPLILRPEYEGIHSSQISLPGGKYENKDKSLQKTAIRETHEEIGVDPTTIHILGKLSDLYVAPSNYLISPFIGYTTQRPEFFPDPIEVAALIEVCIDDLLDDRNITLIKKTFKPGITFNVPCWEIEGNIIWGATAMILSEFRELISDKKALP